MRKNSSTEARTSVTTLDLHDDSELRWTATVEFDDPVDERATDRDAVQRRLAEVLEHHNPTLLMRPDVIAFTFQVVGRDIDEAQHEVGPVLKTIDREFGLRLDRISGVQLEKNSRLDALLNASAPRYVGVVEAAEILSVTKQRVGQLSQRPEFPALQFKLRATPAWLEDDIVAYAATRRRTPGAPGRHASPETAESTSHR